MAINLISHRIDELTQMQPRPFTTTHELISVIILRHRTEWEEFVNNYSGARAIQEQKSVQQIGCYLGRNARRLGVSQGRTIESSTIEGLNGHKPRQTTVWL
jgi:hypothetical protein